MKVFAYYHDPQDNRWSYPAELAARWRESFERRGFEATLLTEHDARRHPFFGEAQEFIKRMPSVNNPVYERACWMRWLAYHLAAPALFTDLDVLNLSLCPEHIPQLELAPLQWDRNPCAVYATPAGILKFLRHFNDSARESAMIINLKPHVGDITLFKRRYRGQRFDLCRDYDDPRRPRAPLVHLLNQSCPEGFRFNERWLLMAQVLQEAGL